MLEMTDHFVLDDCDMYREDLALFQPGRWLNTPCVHFLLLLFQKKDFFVGGARRILVFDPSQVSFLRFQLESQEELDDFRTGNDVDSAEWILLPVNNAASCQEAGSHWSLLAFHVLTTTGIHLDSMRGSNDGQARELLSKINQTLSIKLRREPTFLSLSSSVCPQQQEGYNCGVYTALFAECVAKYAMFCTSSEAMEALLKGELGVWKEIFSAITPESPSDTRKHAINRAQQLMGT